MKDRILFIYNHDAFNVLFDQNMKERIIFLYNHDAFNVFNVFNVFNISKSKYLNLNISIFNVQSK